MQSNRGMFLETIINRTIAYFCGRKIAYFSKRHLPIKVYSFQGRRIQGWLGEKTQTDYYGVYNGYYFDFEAKQVSLKLFPLKNLAAHQLKHLTDIVKYKAFSFVIVLFTNVDKFFLITTEQILDYINKNPQKQSIPYDYFLENTVEISLIFPGILDFEPIFIELIKFKINQT